ncbi:purine and uridine phosphorylase [Aspergillus steynii IBT 23096]|uniref:Purine and uridine phosphorylase n=1 Tax=Aspergillus steynii IBT 23096 TaxID=1392250 RepID=A0A2I2GDR9_9EURO|nr:purine and uridine phosphorylase [Aspergillus steynii IBT 23096]PLB51013.1 purine and uridine phosphorylase [Aspergillus steynii IBT 23096]
MRPRNRSDFSIAIICALTLEADAVEALFDETYDRLGKLYDKKLGDANSYINGRIGEHDVVLCYIPGMGTGSTASIASSLRVSYTGVRLALVVGTCGGAPYPSSEQNIFLGDVIVSDALVQYDFGRQYPGGFQPKRDVKDILGRPEREIRTLLAGLQARRSRIEFQDQMLQHFHIIQQSETRWHHPACEDVLYEASHHHKHRSGGSPVKCQCSGGEGPDDICSQAEMEDCNRLGCNERQVIRRRDGTGVSFHIGKLASASTVMSSGEHRDKIIQTENVIGFEIGGAGVWDNISCIIIKGVCHYADSHNNDKWQAYAAATGASAAKTFLEYWRPIRREERAHHWMVPFGRNPQFGGRLDEISKIEKLIRRDDGPTKIAISGLGGVGKTQVALELAFLMRDEGAKRSIFWIPCTSYESVEKAYMSIAKMVGLQDVKSTEAKERVKTYLSHKDAGKWLLIFDNADDMDMWINGSNTVPALKSFLPQNEQGHVIFTTRNSKLAVKLASSHVISVPELDEETGMELLKKSLINKDLLDERELGLALLKELTFLPLAVTQAVAYINENCIGLADYIALLQEQEPDVVELLSEGFEDEYRYSDAQNPVALTWLISFQQIWRLDKLAADYLSFMACINPRGIPRSLLPQPATAKMRTDAIGLLKAYSFISEQPIDHSLNVHRLVHLAIRSWMRKNQQFAQWTSRAADRFNEVFPDANHDNGKLWRQYLPHALSLVGEVEFQMQQEKYVSLLHKIGNYLYCDGRYHEAELLFTTIMKTQETTSGDKHPDFLAIKANLASTYCHQGRWKEAEELQIQVMNSHRQVLGPEHPDTLISIGNLAAIHQSQGRWKEAEELQVQLIETSKKVLGPEHPSTLTSMGNLASTYVNQGRQKKAEELQLRVMKTCEQVLGPEHPSTLTSMYQVACTWDSLGKVDNALRLMVKCVNLRIKHLGPDHPDTFCSSETLGRWLKRRTSHHRIESEPEPAKHRTRMSFKRLFPERMTVPGHSNTIRKATLSMRWKATLSMRYFYHHPRFHADA